MIPLNIPDFAASNVFLIRVRLLGGAAIIFARSWNFELKFIVDNAFMQKINSTGIGSHSLPKKCSKEPKLEIKNHINVLKKIENDLKNELNPQ